MGSARPVIRIVLVLVALASPFFFSLWFIALLTIMATGVTAWAPLAVGLVLDALFYSHGAFTYPLYSLLGFGATTLAFFVHRFVETSIMRA